MGIFDEFKRLAKPYDPNHDDFEVFADISTKDAKVRPPIDSAKGGEKMFNVNTTTKLEVVVMQPEHFESAADIASHLFERRTVVLNLEKANKEATRRLVDFLSGFVYAMHGKIKPIAKCTYIITPSSIDVMGTELIGELESNGMYI